MVSERDAVKGKVLVSVAVAIECTRYFETALRRCG